MAKDKCDLTDLELIDACNKWVSKLAATGGGAWCLQVPVNFNGDPDMLFVELANRFKERIESPSLPAQPENILARIEENKSMLEMAKLHSDARSILVITKRIEDLEKQNLPEEQGQGEGAIEQIWCVHKYLDDLKIPRTLGAEIYSIVGRIKRLETTFLKKASEIESHYLNEIEPVCTCEEFSKQRALCPVCDKEKYKQAQEFMKDAIKSKQ